MRSAAQSEALPGCRGIGARRLQYVSCPASSPELAGFIT